LFVFVAFGTLARLHGFSVLKVLRCFKEELVVVLGTSSTEPALPRMLMKLEQLGCRKGIPVRSACIDQPDQQRARHCGGLATGRRSRLHRAEPGTESGLR
jgi:hypothetical protein